MTRGNFDLHFTPVEEMDRMAPYHFAVEIEDWDGFMTHLEGLGVRHTRITSRPENNSLFCYIHDPDHTMIELVYHANRPGGAPDVVTHGERSGAAVRPRRQQRGDGTRAARGRLMPFASSADGSTIYYETHGSGPAVGFVHGSGGHHAAWWQQVPHLADRYTVVTLDLRGFGRSDSGMDEFDSRAFPDDILAVLRDAAVGPVVLVGQSIGAAAALKAALREPGLVAGVVLAHSLGGIDHEELAARVRADRAKAEQIPVLDRLLTPALPRAGSRQGVPVPTDGDLQRRQDGGPAQPQRGRPHARRGARLGYPHLPARR